MVEYRPPREGANRQWWVKHDKTMRRALGRQILGLGGSRVATAWFHNLYGITNGNAKEPGRYPLKALWFNLRRKAGDAREVDWFVGRTARLIYNDNGYLLMIELDTIDGILRLSMTGYDAGMQFHWDRDPTPSEQFELMFVMERHVIPVYDPYDGESYRI